MFRPLVIRFWKKGTSRYAVYDIVVTYKDTRYRSSFLDLIGHYNPNGTEKIFFFHGRKLGYWLNRGAKLHPKVSLHLPVEYEINTRNNSNV